MRSIFLIVLIAALVGCTSRTEHGECIGVADDRDPALHYKLSVWNTLLAIVFVELLVPPIVVLASETMCPVGRKAG